MRPLRAVSTVFGCFLLIHLTSYHNVQGQDDQPTDKEVENALRKAGQFFYNDVATHGGYVWSYSGDLQLREGEALTDLTMIWVQPPATPTIGETFLEAYKATHERLYMNAAVDAAGALMKGQMRSGGWYYSVEFDPEKRLKYAYLDSPPRKKQQKKSTLDDDVTQSAVRFLMQVDQLLEFKNSEVHESVELCLTSLLNVQYRNGAWYQWWDDPNLPRDGDEFPVIAASPPDSWSRIWPNAWAGRYFLNDNVMADMIDTMLLAYDIYEDERYLNSAIQAGDFLLLAQMPAPQPAWAQQYDPAMHPVWDRKFEPPAISGAESQGVMKSLLLLYRRTGQRKFLEAIPPALRYLRASTLPNGKLARFYELKTNRPLYFKVTGKRYDLTYDDKHSPKHYAFQVDSSLDRIEDEYQRLAASQPHQPRPTATKPRARKRSNAEAARIRTILQGMDERGAWVEDGVLDGHEVRPKSGIIHARTFVKNMKLLIDYLNATP